MLSNFCTNNFPLFEQQSILVHTKSLSVHSPHPPSYREYLAANNRENYEAAEKFLMRYSMEECTSHYARFVECRTKSNFARHSITGEVKVLTSSCHVRFCPFCGKSRATMIFRNVTSWLEKIKYPKFLTLTLKHEDEPLTEQLDKLYECFRKFRRISLIKRRVFAGVWFFQIKKSKNDGLWHPHLHCIMDGGYIPRKKISNEWRRITGESMVVDIRMIRNPKKAADYVSRYAVDPCDIKTLEYSDQKILFESLKKRRLCGTWGKAKKMKLTTPPKFDPEGWKCVGSWDTVLRMKESDEHAKLIYESWLYAKPLPEKIEVKYVDDFINGKPPPLAILETRKDQFLF